MLAVLGPLGAVLAMPLAAAGRDAFRYVFRRSAGLSPEEAAAPSPPEDGEGAAEEGAGGAQQAEGSPAGS
jgi:hypothetical protein